jgi:hypothetical protein
VPFTDPDGTYELELDPSWESDESSSPSIEVWTIEDSRGAATVSITSERSDRRSVDDAVRYVRGALEDRPQGDVEIDGEDELTSTAGRPIGRLAMTRRIGSQRVAQQAYITIGSGQLVIMLVSAEQELADDVFADAEPYALTLKGVGPTT